MHEDQPMESPLTDAELDARLTDPAVIARGLKDVASEELAVKILTDFKALSQGIALRDQSQADDPKTRAELELIMAARLMSNTVRAIPDADAAAAWLALRLVAANQIAVAGAKLQAQAMVGKMLDPSSEDTEHLGKVADALLNELAQQHPENPQARKHLVLRALDVARKREQAKPGDLNTGQYL